MIIIFPLVPIIIAILLTVYGLVNEAMSALTTIRSVAWLIIAICYSILIVFIIKNKEISRKSKIRSTFLSILASVLSLVETNVFFVALSFCNNNSIGGTINTIITMFFCGIIWLGSLIMCAYASSLLYDEPDYNNRYSKAELLIIGSVFVSLITAAICDFSIGDTIRTITFS